MTIKGTGRVAREVFLTFGALLGALCIVVTIASVAFGIKPLVFRSGSMSPAIHTGDLAVSRTVDASSLKTGDIVSVVNSEGNRVTHRLVNAAAQGAARQLTLKGDANKSADTEVYTVTRTERVLFHIPKAGYVVNAAASPAGVFVLGVYVTAMLLIVFRRRGPGDGPTGGRRKGGARKAESKGGRKTSRAAGTAVFAAALAIASPAAAAPWINASVVSGTEFTAYIVPKPTVTSCSVTGNAVTGFTATITWPGVTTPYAFTYTARLVESPQNLTVTTVATNRRAQVTSGLLGSLLGTTVNVRINTVLPGTPTWVSANANQPLVVGLLGLSLTCGTPT